MIISTQRRLGGHRDIQVHDEAGLIMDTTLSRASLRELTDMLEWVLADWPDQQSLRDIQPSASGLGLGQTSGPPHTKAQHES